VRSAAALQVQPVSRFFKALGDETRLRIVALLSHGELCVCHLETALKLTQPTASRHLGVLRTAGVVEATRRGHWVYYQLAPQQDELRKDQLAQLVSAFGSRKLLQKDLARLVRVKGPASCP
jgi:ArsR family transcriptional regulator